MPTPITNISKSETKYIPYEFNVTSIAMSFSISNGNIKHETTKPQYITENCENEDTSDSGCKPRLNSLFKKNAIHGYKF